MMKTECKSQYSEIKTITETFSGPANYFLQNGWELLGIRSPHNSEMFEMLLGSKKAYTPDELQELHQKSMDYLGSPDNDYA